MSFRPQRTVPLIDRWRVSRSDVLTVSPTLAANTGPCFAHPALLDLRRRAHTRRTPADLVGNRSDCPMIRRVTSPSRTRLSIPLADSQSTTTSRRQAPCLLVALTALGRQPPHMRCGLAQELCGDEPIVVNAALRGVVAAEHGHASAEVVLELAG
jgi:hypothetical protein